MQAEDPAPVTRQGRSDGPQPTSYEVLQVHPAAPLELITAAYWRLAGQAQTRRAMADAAGAEADLHMLTRAYQTLTNPALRAEYDRSVGIAEQSLAPQVPNSRRRRVFGRKRLGDVDSRVDYYEILRIVPTAQPPIVEEAYSTLRTFYVRLVQSGYSPIELLEYLEEAYFVASDSDRRQAYDGERKRVVAGATAAAGAAPPKPKAQPKAKPTTPPARPKVTAVRVSSRPYVKRSPGGSPLGAITGAVGALGRQFSTMSRREQQQLEHRLAEREREQVDPGEVEAALLQRISSTVEGPASAEPATPGSLRPVARLTVIDGPDAGTIFNIENFPLTLGGDDECDITLPGLASERARLLFRDGRFVVYNLAPSEPAANGEAEPWWIVESGGDLGLGPYKLRFAAISD